MKKIVPFNNILEFNTDVSEITAISLEHEITSSDDCISGVFKISGEYKINDGDIKKEMFNFTLPFDIALSTSYVEDSLVIDIDDFRYDLIESNKIKVNIDLYIDGEEKKEIISSNDIRCDKEEILEDIELPKEEKNEVVFNQIERVNLMDSIKTETETENNVTIDEDNINNNEINITIDEDNINNNEINIFNGFNENEEYVTYKVYRVMEGDTLDSILTKYNIDKEELANYNLIDEIIPGDKLIIPYHDK